MKYILLLSILFVCKAAGPYYNMMDYLSKRLETEQVGAGCIASPDQQTNYVFNDYLEIVYFLVPHAYAHRGVHRVKITKIEALSDPYGDGIYCLDVTYSYKDSSDVLHEMTRRHGCLRDPMTNTRVMLERPYDSSIDNYFEADQVTYSEDGTNNYFTGLHFQAKDAAPVPLNIGSDETNLVKRIETDASALRYELMALAGQFQPVTDGGTKGGRLMCLKLYYQK